MINILVKQIDIALKNESFIPALMASLTLPDICGKAEYPDSNNKKRYVEWYDTYIPHGLSPFYDYDKTNKLPVLSGEVVYQLRCSLLHSGSFQIERNRIICSDNKIDSFEIYIEPKNDNDIYIIYLGSSDNSKNIRVGIRGLCKMLTQTASAYYVKYREKFEN